MKKTLKSSDLVVQHNDLIQANYPLTLQEKRIVLWLSSQVKKDDEEFKDHEMKISDFCELAGIKSKNMYKEIEKISTELMQKVLQIRKENSLMVVSWLSYAEYFYREGKIVLRFDPALKPYLLNLKEKFTQINLSQLLSFKSFYSVRMYELLYQYISIGERNIKVDEIKSNLGIEKEKYKSYADLKKYVVLTALKEINEKSDIQVGFEEVKNGRKVTALNFQITHKVKDFEENSIISRAAVFNITNEEIQTFLNDVSLENLDRALRVLESCTKKIKNPWLFLKKALAENWQPSSVIERSSNITDSELTVEREIETLSESVECKNIRKNFIRQHGEKEYTAWLDSAEMELENTVLKVRVRSAFLAHYIQVHYTHVLKSAAKDVEHVEVSVKTNLEILDDGKEKNQSVSTKPVSIEKSVASTKRKTGSPKKKTINKPDNEDPKLKQLTLWDRVRTFLKPNSDV